MAKAIVKVGADTSELNSKLAGAKNSIRSFGEGIKSSFGGLAGILSLGAIGAGLNSIGQKFSRIGDIASNTGLGVDMLQKLDLEASRSGSSLEQLAKAFRKFQIEALGGKATKEQANAFRFLGIELDDLARMEPEKQLMAMVRAISGAGNEADQLRALNTVLGDTSGKFQDILVSVNALAKNGLPEMTTATKEEIETIKVLTDGLEEARVTLQAGIGSKLGGLVKGGQNIFEDLIWHWNDPKAKEFQNMERLAKDADERAKLFPKKATLSDFAAQQDAKNNTIAALQKEKENLSKMIGQDPDSKLTLTQKLAKLEAPGTFVRTAKGAYGGGGNVFSNRDNRENDKVLRETRDAIKAAKDGIESIDQAIQTITVAR